MRKLITDGIPEDFAQRLKVIATDLDGTFVGQKLQILPETLEAYSRAQKEGIPIFIATGRSFFGAKKLLSCNTPPDDISVIPGVYLNGLHTIDVDRSQPPTPMGEPICRSVIQLVETINSEVTKHDPDWFEEDEIKNAPWEHGVPVLGPDTQLPLTYVSLIAYCANEDDTFTGEILNRLLQGFEGFQDGKLVTCERGWDELLATKIPIKLSVIFHTAACAKKYQERFAETAKDITVVAAIPRMLEISPSGTSKATGLAWICKRFGCDLSEVAAIGDGDNDVEMLRESGLGIAMGNASENAKNAAQIETEDAVQNGWAIAIHALLDSRKKVTEKFDSQF